MALSTPFTINDFPPEIIELFLPDNKRSTICTLKLVNKKFYQVFRRDRFFKCYLHYPEKFYLSDLDFESRAQGVKEVVDKIKRRVWGQYEGYLSLQKAHLDNLRSGRVDCFDTITVIGEDLISYMELLDGSNHHWLCCEFKNGHINMTNLATKRSLSHNLGNYHAIIFLPGLILMQKVDLTFAVHKLIDKDGVYSLQLQYEAVLSREINLPFNKNPKPFVFMTNSGKSKSTSTMRNFLVGWETKDNKGMFCTWDLDTGAKSIISLGDQLGTSFTSGLLLRFVEGEFPNVIGIFSHIKSTKLIYVFNLETNRITHRLGNWTKVNMTGVTMCSNVVSVCFGDDLKIYRLAQSGPGVLCDAELIYTVAAPSHCQFTSDTFVVWLKEDVVHILNIIGSGFEEKTFVLPTDYKYIGFFAPDVILLKRSGSLAHRYRNSKNIKVVNLKGEHLFDWKLRKVFLDDELNTFMVKLEWWYPSRIVILSARDGTSNLFKVYHF